MPSQNQEKNDDEAFMRLALAEAARGLGHTSPNPAVGAVIVKDGEVLARGYHHAAGQPHAEVEALRALANPEDARGATIYVTLEPCSTQGRTGPCTEAIQQSGVARAVIGTVDPNPRHAGAGIEVLERAGINTRTGVLAADCEALNPGFNKWIVSGLPWVIAKAALTLDGRLTLPPQDGRWLSGEEARAHAHRQRARVDAILIGAGTLRADDPQLTVRTGAAGTRQPWRVVVTRGGELPASARLFTDAHRDRTLVFKRQPLAAVLRELGRRQVTSVLIEGGGAVLGKAFAKGLWDEVQFYLTPHLAGGPILVSGGRRREAIRLTSVSYERIGNDIFVTGRPDQG